MREDDGTKVAMVSEGLLRYYTEQLIIFHTMIEEGLIKTSDVELIAAKLEGGKY